MHGLAAGGAAGVTRRLAILRRELALALPGRARLAEMDRSVIG